MRVFVGVELGDAARDMAVRVASELKRQLGTRLDARWVPPENMHLTVRFIGDVPDERAPAVLDALGHPLEFKPFVIELGGCGRFPPRGAPRAIWIGLPGGLPSLTALHEEFNRRLAPLEYDPEDRLYTAHLTLARIKDARAAAAREIDTAFARVRTGTVTQRVEAVTVFESRLSPKGSTYHAQLRVPLYP
jgi:2'-5' RNA ligase